MKVETWPIGKPKPYAKNPRKNAAAVAKVAASLKAFGWRQPIVVDKKGVIIAGHTRLLAARELGLKEVPVHVATNLSETQVRAYRLADNRSGQEAEWDDELLAGELAALQFDEFDLSLTGFDPDELTALLNPDGGLLPGVDPDDVPPVPEAPITKPGDLILLGKHRLLCGDSTDRASWNTLVDGATNPLCLTDPPYGIGLDYGESYEDSEQNLALLAAKWLPIARDICPVVVFSPGVTRQWLYPEPSWVICWFYGGGQLRSPWGFNCWQPFLCYGKDPSLATGNGCKPDAVDLNTPSNSGDLAHPCPKPVALWAWIIERLSYDSQQVIVDPFAGSGTTFIVCETMGRTALGIELSPAYCDVIVARWENATGQQAVRP